MPADSFAQLEALNQARHIRSPSQLEYRFNIEMAMTFLVPLQSWHNLMSEDQLVKSVSAKVFQNAHLLAGGTKQAAVGSSFTIVVGGGLRGAQSKCWS
jgi:hypothetical protein